MLARNAIVEGLPATKVPVLGMPEPWSSRVPPEVMEVVPLLVKCAEMKVSPLPPDLVSAPSLLKPGGLPQQWKKSRSDWMSAEPVEPMLRSASLPMLTVPVPDQVEVPLTVTVLLSKVLVADPEMAMPAPDEMTVDPEPPKEPPVQASSLETLS